ncbi:MAG: hypothetical protein MHM6MM_001459 [Cercozoa sp. M6MM]
MNLSFSARLKRPRRQHRKRSHQTKTPSWKASLSLGKEKTSPTTGSRKVRAKSTCFDAKTRNDSRSSNSRSVSNPKSRLSSSCTLSDSYGPPQQHASKTSNSSSLLGEQSRTQTSSVSQQRIKVTCFEREPLAESKPANSKFSKTSDLSEEAAQTTPRLQRPTTSSRRKTISYRLRQLGKKAWSESHPTTGTSFRGEIENAPPFALQHRVQILELELAGTKKRYGQKLEEQRKQLLERASEAELKAEHERAKRKDCDAALHRTQQQYRRLRQKLDTKSQSKLNVRVEIDADESKKEMTQAQREVAKYKQAHARLLLKYNRDILRRSGSSKELPEMRMGESKINGKQVHPCEWLQRSDTSRDLHAKLCIPRPQRTSKTVFGDNSDVSRELDRIRFERRWRKSNELRQVLRAAMSKSLWSDYVARNAWLCDA